MFLCGMPSDIKMANGKLLWFLNQLFFWNEENVQTYGNAGCSLKYVVFRTLRSQITLCSRHHTCDVHW